MTQLKENAVMEKRSMNGLVDRAIYKLARAGSKISCRVVKETLSFRVSERTLKEVAVSIDISRIIDK